MDHIPKTLSPTGKLDSAPKEFSVYVSANKHFYSLQISIWTLFFFREWHLKKMMKVLTLADSLMIFMDLLFSSLL